MTVTTPHQSIASIGDAISPLINAHIDTVFRRILPGPGASIDSHCARMQTGEAHPYANFATIDPRVDIGALDTAIEPLVRQNKPAAVLFAGATDDRLVQRLNESGFARASALPMMAVDLDRLSATTLPAGYTFARVRSIADRERWGDVFTRGYGLPPRAGAAFARGIDGNFAADAELQYFWIPHNASEPVCTSLMYLKDGVAGIYAVATLEAHRRNGLGAHATAEPLQIARTLGYRVGILQASAAGQPVYRRLGFREFGEIPIYVRMPADSTPR